MASTPRDPSDVRIDQPIDRHHIGPSAAPALPRRASSRLGAGLHELAGRVARPALVLAEV
jgi:hypothetical protein